VLLRTGRRCIVVKSEGEVIGLITAQEIRGVERTRWSRPGCRNHASDRKLEDGFTRSSGWDALKTMVHDDLNQLPVATSF
jgi:hypothetical protein